MHDAVVVGQPSLTKPSLSLSALPLQIVSAGPTAGQPSLTSPSASLSVALVPCAPLSAEPHSPPLRQIKGGVRLSSMMPLQSLSTPSHSSAPVGKQGPYSQPSAAVRLKKPALHVKPQAEFEH